jgi:hypothetical protein
MTTNDERTTASRCSTHVAAIDALAALVDAAQRDIDVGLAARRYVDASYFPKG